MTFVQKNRNIISVSKLKSCALAVNLATSKLTRTNLKYFGTALALSLSTSVAAQQTIDIPAQPLAKALKELGNQTGVELIYNASLIEGKKSNAVKGKLDVNTVFKQLLSNTGLVAIKQSNGSFVIKAVDDKQVAGTLSLTKVKNRSRFGDTPKEPDGFKADYQTTATKIAMPLKETPQAISVITRDALEARQVKDIATAIEFSAGASEGGSFAGPGPFGGRGQFGTTYNLRGQSPNYYTGILSDGFVLGSLIDLDFSAYERVEVMKGPSGFYGQGSLGGFINLVRKKPEQEFKGNITTQIGSFDTYRVEGDVTGSITENEGVVGRLTGAYEKAGSFVSGVDGDMFQFAPSIETDIGENTRALLQLLYQKENYIANQGLPLHLEGDQLSAYDLPRSFFFGAGNLGDESENEVFDALAKIEHNISDRWLATLVLQSNTSTRNAIMSSSGSQYDGYAYLYAAKHLTDYDHWSGDLRLQGSFDAFGHEHQVVVGAEHSKREFHVDYSYVELGYTYLYAGNFADFGILSEDQIPTTPQEDNKADITAFYTQAVLKLHEKTQLLMNVRYDQYNIEGTYQGEVSNPNDDSATTFRLGLTHELSDNISGYLSYAQSFEPVYDIGEDGNFLKPETGEGYELGFKSDWFDNLLSITVAAYRQELTNTPISHPNPNNDPLLNNVSVSAGLHRTDGIELEIAGSPIAGLDLAFAADWSDNEYLDADDDNVGLSAEGTTDNRYSMYANYEIQSGVFTGLGIGATLVYVGDRNFIYTPDEESPFQTYLKGYNRLDLNMSYIIANNWDISLQVRNVFDKKYIERTSGQENFRSYFGSPSAVLLNVSYNFD
jgi:outer membrane receptor for ferric coprogen and ferric-rhodotorulic acid